MTQKFKKNIYFLSFSFGKNYKTEKLFPKKKKKKKIIFKPFLKFFSIQFLIFMTIGKIINLQYLLRTGELGINVPFNLLYINLKFIGMDKRLFFSPFPFYYGKKKKKKKKSCSL